MRDTRGSVPFGRKHVALRVTTLYVLVGAAWILFSDGLVLALVREPAIRATVEMAKGWLYMLATAALLYGLIRRSLHLIQDSELALQDSEGRHRAFLEALPDMLFRFRSDGTILDFMPAKGFAPLLPPERFLGRKLQDVVPGDASQALVRGVAQALQTGLTETVAYHLTEAGETRYYEASLVHARADEALAIVRNVTQRHDAAEALALAATKWQTTFDATSDSVCLTDTSGAILQCNVAAARLLGTSPHEVVERDRFELVQRQGVPFAGHPLSRMLETGVRATEDLAVGAEWFRVAVDPLRDQAGAIVGAVHIMSNITAHKQADEALADSESRYRLLAENSSDVILTVDDTHRLSYISPSVLEFLGYSIEEMSSHPIAELITSAFVDVDSQALPQPQTGRAPARRAHTVELALQRRDGESLWVEARVSRLFDAAGQPLGILGVLRDVSERRRAAEEREKMQAQLLQAQKMEAIGTLAGGVAHDFNNILTAIQGYADLALREVDEGHSVHRDLTQIRTSCVRAAGLTRQLLLFSRRQRMAFGPVQLDKLVENVLSMLQRIIGEDIIVHTDLQPGLWSVRADIGNIEQVIMNLAANAHDAMPMGGALTIQAENVTLSEGLAQLMPGARAGRHVRLTVCDTGVGMPSEVLQHLFEPFYTTKEAGKGTGLGLAVVYGIVQQHDGWISVYSEAGVGSSFRVYLPAAESAPPEDLPDEQTLQAYRGQGERILLVEDEDAIRRLAVRALRENGYVVGEAANAAEALTALERGPEPFDLVFTDTVMPGASGLELVERLLVRQPDLGVMLCSGYTDQKAQWTAIREKGYRFLAKPYALQDLLRNLREALDALT